ncbi:MAG: DNA gyrase inhibitor YacG [Acidobacteria bacterium]|nr:DNA gyrase inhibitor YacG [Acidobacteriota bacterium]
MLIVKCPECGKDVDLHSSEFRPFCSERCKLLDFGAWADESYSLPAEATSLSEDDIEAVERAQRDK